MKLCLMIVTALFVTSLWAGIVCENEDYRVDVTYRSDVYGDLSASMNLKIKMPGYSIRMSCMDTTDYNPGTCLGSMYQTRRGGYQGFNQVSFSYNSDGEMFAKYESNVRHNVRARETIIPCWDDKYDTAF
ncbi:MAG: hypothetical protein ACOCUH_01575 [Bacteriovoracia bacterium]